MSYLQPSGFTCIKKRGGGGQLKLRLHFTKLVKTSFNKKFIQEFYSIQYIVFHQKAYILIDAVFLESNIILHWIYSWGFPGLCWNEYTCLFFLWGKIINKFDVLRCLRNCLRKQICFVGMHIQFFSEDSLKQEQNWGGEVFLLLREFSFLCIISIFYINLSFQLSSRICPFLSQILNFLGTSLQHV